MTNNLVLISEFVPVHKGYESALREHISIDVANVLFCIDGAHRKLSDETPFSTQERQDMIALMMQQFDMPYSILHLRDEDNDKDRKDSIAKLLSPLSGVKVLSDHKPTNEIIKELGYDTTDISRSCYIPGILRNQIAGSHIDALRKKLPEDIIQYLYKIDGYERSREFKDKLFHGPGITVDIVAFTADGKIVIIDRGGEPFGLALPGGFFNFMEIGTGAAIRENKEEDNTTGKPTLLAAQKKLEDALVQMALNKELAYPYEHQPFYVMTDPQRDKRGHLITLAYALEIDNIDDLTALDDARKVYLMTPQEALANPDVLPDHKTLIAAYMQQNLA